MHPAQLSGPAGILRENVGFYNTVKCQANLASCIKNGDLTTFSALLADVAPLDDANHLSLPDDEKEV